MNNQKKTIAIQNHFQQIVNLLTGSQKENFQGTAQHLTKLYTHTIFKQQPIEQPSFTLLKNTQRHNQIIIQKNIPIKTFCPHHLLPFFGKVNIAYQPQKYLIGLSDLHKIVDYCLVQPQIQEVLTEKIAQTIKKIVKTIHVGIIIEATHTCVIMRSKAINNNTITTSFHGIFNEKYQQILQ